MIPNICPITVVNSVRFLSIDYSYFQSHMEMQKKLFKTDWLATPNAYRREEIEETGTPTPKKFTKVFHCKSRIFSFLGVFSFLEVTNVKFYFM